MKYIPIRIPSDTSEKISAQSRDNIISTVESLLKMMDRILNNNDLSVQEVANVIISLHITYLSKFKELLDNDEEFDRLMNTFNEAIKDAASDENFGKVGNE